ncbi:hypothetical protein QQ045_009560 [Rhodiola kirilowii]
MMNAKPIPYDSSVWKCLCSAKEILKSGFGRGQQDHGLDLMQSRAGQWEEHPNQCGGNIWKINVPERIKIMVWRAFHDSLPVTEKLQRRGCNAEFVCCYCGFEWETAKHLFGDWWWAKWMWNKLEVENCGNGADWLWFYMTDGV